MKYKCYWSVYDNPHFCAYQAKKKEFQAFQALLDKADKENTHDIDKDYCCEGDYKEVDEKFFACPAHVKDINCNDCEKLLTRHQIHNYLNSEDYNHNGDPIRNFGIPTRPSCTACCVKNDYQLRCEVGLENYDESDTDTDTETVSSKESAPKPSRNTVMASEIPLPPSPPPLNLYQEFYVQQHPGIKAANPTWTPQQITTEIGRRWSLQQMSISQSGDDITVLHAKKKHKIDGCSKGTELRMYLEAYRAKHGHEALLKLVETLSA